jgi:hypothetical protein
VPNCSSGRPTGPVMWPVCTRFSKTQPALNSFVLVLHICGLENRNHLDQLKNFDRMTGISKEGSERWGSPIRAAQTGVFDLDIRISNRLFIDVCTSCAAETGLNSRNVEKRINAV